MANQYQQKAHSKQYQQAQLNFSQCLQEINWKEIDQTVQEFIDFSNEDHISELEINPSFNDLIRGSFPTFFQNKSSKFDSPQHYINNMYEILRESFMQPIKDIFKQMLCVSSIEEFKQKLTDLQAKQKVFILHEVTKKKVSLNEKGLFVTFQVEQKNQFEYNSDIEDFQSLKKQSLVILIDQKSGAMIFGTVLDSRQEQTPDNNQNQNQEEEVDEEEEIYDTQQKLINKSLEQEEQLQSEQSNEENEIIGNAQKLKKFPTQIKINMNSNNYIDVISQFNSDEKQFIMIEASNYWLPIYYNLKVLYYMRQKKEQLYIPFEEQILQGKQLQNDSFPEYQQLQKDPQLIAQRKKKILDQIRVEPCDQHQKDSLQEMLTKKIQFVEGPPGTGKTHLAVKSVMKLIQTYSVPSQQWKPIIILCKKNVSLDSFLRQLIQQNEKSVLRVGNPVDEILKEFSLNLKFRNEKLKNIQQSKKMINFDKLFNGNLKELSSIFITNIFKNFKINLPKILMKAFLNQFFSTLDLNKEKDQSFKNFKADLFNKWIKNELNYQDMLEIINKNGSIKNFLNNQKQKYEFERDYENYLNNQAQDKNMDKIILKMYQKPLIDQNFSQLNQKERFQLKSERLQYTTNQQVFIQKLLKINSFNDFNGELRMLIHQFALYQCKLEKIKEQYRFYKQEIIEVREINQRNNEHTILQIMKQHKIIGNFFQLIFKLQQSFLDRQKNNYQKNQKITLIQTGMTTTGFTMKFKFIQMMKPEILIVEEASEIDEWNCAIMLQPYIKHIIQIGDYKQLTPIQPNKNFCYQYNSNKSQFERLLDRLKFKPSKLIFQRRMVNQLADFPRQIYSEDFYKDELTSQDKLKQKQLLDNPLVFIEHTFEEKISNNSPSYSNMFEAQLSLHISYILLKEYNIPSSEITILCMYKSQKKCIQDLINNYPQKFLENQQDESKIQIQTVDEYQGKENNYIILSCVRCNKDLQVGFLTEQNRMNVAFSRAKLGLIVIGAFWMYPHNSSKWKNFINVAKKHNAFISDQENQNNIFLNSFTYQIENNINPTCVINHNHSAHFGICDVEIIDNFLKAKQNEKNPQISNNLEENIIGNRNSDQSLQNNTQQQNKKSQEESQNNNKQKQKELKQKKKLLKLDQGQSFHIDISEPQNSKSNENEIQEIQYDNEKQNNREKNLIENEQIIDLNEKQQNNFNINDNAMLQQIANDYNEKTIKRKYIRKQNSSEKNLIEKEKIIDLNEKQKNSLNINDQSNGSASKERIQQIQQDNQNTDNILLSQIANENSQKTIQIKQISKQDSSEKNLENQKILDLIEQQQNNFDINDFQKDNVSKDEIKNINLTQKQSIEEMLIEGNSHHTSNFKNCQVDLSMPQYSMINNENKDEKIDYENDSLKLTDYSVCLNGQNQNCNFQSISADNSYETIQQKSQQEQDQTMFSLFIEKSQDISNYSISINNSQQKQYDKMRNQIEIILTKTLEDLNYQLSNIQNMLITLLDYSQDQELNEQQKKMLDLYLFCSIIEEKFDKFYSLKDQIVLKTIDVRTQFIQFNRDILIRQLFNFKLSQKEEQNLENTYEEDIDVINPLINLLRIYIFYNNPNFLKKLNSFQKFQMNIIDKEWVLLQLAIKEIEGMNNKTELFFVGEIHDSILSFQFKQKKLKNFETSQFNYFLTNGSNQNNIEQKINTKLEDYLKRLFQKEIILLIKNKNQWKYITFLVENTNNFIHQEECSSLIILCREKGEPNKNNNETQVITIQQKYLLQMFNSIYTINAIDQIIN